MFLAFGILVFLRSIQRNLSGRLRNADDAQFRELPNA
jgi:hypothetical protein